MPVTRTELDGFHRFAVSKLSDAGSEFSFEELVDLWLVERASPKDRQNDVLAVKAAIRDMENGDRGIPFEEHLHQVRDKPSRFAPATWVRSGKRPRCD